MIETLFVGLGVIIYSVILIEVGMSIERQRAKDSKNEAAKCNLNFYGFKSGGGGKPLKSPSPKRPGSRAKNETE